MKFLKYGHIIYSWKENFQLNKNLSITYTKKLSEKLPEAPDQVWCAQKLLTQVISANTYKTSSINRYHKHCTTNDDSNISNESLLGILNIIAWNFIV